MSLRTLSILCAAVCCLFPLPAVAAENLTAVVQKKYDSIQSMRAEFNQTLLHKESGAKEARTGSLRFKKPLLVRWETEKPAPELLVVSKSEIWNVFPDEDVAYKYPLSMVQDTRSLIRVITGQARLEQDFTVENEGAEEGLTKLRMYPKEPVQALVEAVFWVEPSSGLIKKFRIYDFYGNENEVTFTNQAIDASLSDSIFSYKPAQGMTVEDRTADTGPASQPLLQ